MDKFEKVAAAGFVELKTFPPNWWLNAESRIGFEFGAVEDADSKWLDECLKEAVPDGDFVFYFAYGTPMNEGVCRGILARIGRPELRPDMRLITPGR